MTAPICSPAPTAIIIIGTSARDRPNPRQLRQHPTPPAAPRRRPPLNRAIHIIALSRARTDPATRAYLERKHAEGKSKREAIRCLKRHFARPIWRILYAAAPPPSQLTHPPPHG